MTSNAHELNVQDTAGPNSPALDDRPTLNSDTRDRTPHEVVPEGGLHAWSSVLGCSLIMCGTFGVALSFGVFQDYYTRIFLTKSSVSTISWIGSTQLFFVFGSGLPAGRLFDEGYLWYLTGGGSVLYIFSFFMLSLARPDTFYQVFLSQAVGMGVGMGFLILPAIAIPSHYFRRRRLVAMGFIYAGSSIGGVIYPVMLNKLINSNLGFAWGVRVVAFITFGVLVLGNGLIRPRPSFQKKKSLTIDVKVPVHDILTDTAYWMANIGGFFVFWGLFFPFFYLQLFGIIHGIDQNLSFYSLTVLNSATVFGRTLPNWVADKYGPMNVTIPMTAISGVLIFAMLGASTPGVMFTFAVLYGFFAGSFISMLSAITVEFSRSIHEVGTRMGIATLIFAVASLTGTPIAGALLKPPAYEWMRPIIFSSVMMLVGVVALCVSRQMATHQRGTWRA